MKQSLLFTGDPGRHPQHAHRDCPQEEPYIAPPPLIQAVNLALHLERPLLLEGEPGCGKTRLAYAVAYELGWPLYRWDVRSTSKAQEGLWTYDALLRLHDVQVRHLGGNTPRDPSDPTRYRTWGALGNAFRVTGGEAVVLIDEIDKADLDFPNDLLAVLDAPWMFKVTETDETVTAQRPPLVMITSNQEKGDLPGPFLRRCLYHWVAFPTEEDLRKIVERHARITHAAVPEKPLLTAALERFQTLRAQGGLHKNPGTSELLDWLNALQHFTPKPYQIANLTDPARPLPYPELLFKLKGDWMRHAQAESI